MSRNGDVFAAQIPRDLEEAEEFSQAARNIQPDRQQFDEWISDLCFEICRIPELFDIVVGDVRVAFYVGSQQLGVPRLAIMFGVTQSTVRLLWVERVE